MKSRISVLRDHSNDKDLIAFLEYGPASPLCRQPGPLSISIGRGVIPTPLDTIDARSLLVIDDACRRKEQSN